MHYDIIHLIYSRVLYSAVGFRFMVYNVGLVVLMPHLLDVPFTIPEGALAGGAAGVVVETALYPIDTIKTRLQVS
jgi:hypothetical protein